jgi:hypothetical protein
MKTVVATIRGVSPYSQSRSYEVDKLQGEGFEDYERRTWRNRLHVDQDGNVFVPPSALKNALAETAKFLSVSVPGKGKATYTKHFEAGVLAVKPLTLDIKADEVGAERLFVPADGRRGSGKRVYKTFPIIHNWGGEVEFLVVDETVLQTHADDPKKTVMQHVFERCGEFVGIGRFRPRNNGFYGRFAVDGFAIS